MNTAKKTVTLIHKTWLASIGTYDSGRENVVNKFDQLYVDGSSFVNDLLEKGESLDAKIQAKLETRKMLKNKISALKAKLGFDNESRDQQIDMLSQRVDSLIEVVAKLAQQKATEKKATATVSTTKKQSVKPTAPKTPAKATATKPRTKAATKPAPKKVTATKVTTKSAATNKPKGDTKD